MFGDYLFFFLAAFFFGAAFFLAFFLAAIVLFTSLGVGSRSVIAHTSVPIKNYMLDRASHNKCAL
jgi:hypothetical protein